MKKANFLQDAVYKKPRNIQRVCQWLYFPLARYDYTLVGMLNNENRWYTKIVCRIRNNKDFRYYVSTTYAKHDDYLRLIETTTFLKCNNKLTPDIVKLYSRENTVVCGYIGEFLSSYLTDNAKDIFPALSAVFKYMEEINQINRSYNTFIIPSIVRTSLELSDEFAYEFNFLPKTKAILPKLEKSANKFLYGCGVEDPHIWNFRIRKSSGKTQALTTDFDYFLDRVNCFWELGYFYATFRWFKKISFSLVTEAEKILLSLIQRQDLKSEFMFWLGTLSSYCGYKDSLRNLIANGGITELEEQYRAIKELDEKVSYLAKELL